MKIRVISLLNSTNSGRLNLEESISIKVKKPIMVTSWERLGGISVKNVTWEWRGISDTNVWCEDENN